MTRELLVISADFDPYPSSNTNCIKPLLDKLIKEGYSIDVVTRRMDDTSLRNELFGGLNILRIDDRRCINSYVVNSHQRNIKNSLFRNAYKIYGFASKAAYYIRYCLFSKEQRVSGWRVGDIIPSIEKEFGNKNYDAILTIALPEITHEIGEKVHEYLFPKSKWIVYDYDPIGYNRSQYNRLSQKYFLRRQMEIYEKCDHIFMGPELYDFYLGTPFHMFKKKISILPFANMKETQQCYNSCKNLLHGKGIICTYAGALAKDIRNPQYAIDLFSDSSLKSICDFNIITGSRTEYFLKEIEKMSNIHIIGKLPYNDSIACLMESDILINIGNTVSFQVPGKVFEYMALGKPIIHISKIENDPTNKYL